MFVQTNSVRAVKEYMKNRLIEHFSESEIRSIINTAICERLKIDYSDLISANDQLLSESDLLYFRGIVKRLLVNEPFQYIIGHSEFYGLNIKSDKRALIPRPETEELVEWMKETFTNQQNLKLVDICTGTGCIALALKSIFKDSTVIGSDYSKEAIELAKENTVALNLAVDFLEFDALTNSAYPFKENEFDAIVSNPPYIPEVDKLEMSQNVLDFEPHLALFVENDSPIVFYQKIAENALTYLKPNGYLFFEIHERFAKEVLDDLIQKGFVNCEVKKDLQGKDRMVKAQKKD